EPINNNNNNRYNNQRQRPSINNRQRQRDYNQFNYNHPMMNVVGGRQMNFNRQLAPQQQHQQSFMPSSSPPLPSR
ncbi:hypothetical protein BLA29_014980, partial [Euroglyphus maynei]